jgi:molecular chaperone Hsp33
MTDSWQAGAIVVQALPNSERARLGEAEEDWRRAMVLLETASDRELLDPALSPDDLLFRLFHEDGVRVYAPLALTPGCGCDEDRVTAMLQSFSLDDLLSMRQEDGSITVTCQFCSRTYHFDQDRLAGLTASRRH